MFVNCAIDSNKKFLGVVTDTNFLRISQNIVQAKEPRLTKEQEAFWNGKGWSIQKIVRQKIEPIPSLIVEKKLRIEDSFHNQNCIQFLNTQLSVLNLAILKKIENNDKIPKKWNDYKKVLLKNIETSKNELISENDLLPELNKVNLFHELYEHYSTTNYYYNGQMIIDCGYDIDYMNEVLDPNHSFFNLLKENSDIFQFQLENPKSALCKSTREGGWRILEDNRVSFDSRENGHKWFTCDPLPKDFTIKYQKTVIVEKGKTEKFVKEYESEFKRLEHAMRIPSMIDFLEDRFIFSKRFKYSTFLQEFFFSDGSQSAKEAVESEDSNRPNQPVRKLLKPFNIPTPKTGPEEVDGERTPDYNIFFKNIIDINQLISSEVDVKRFSKKELNPKKPIPRN
jgi:hypothetical protein